MPVQNPHHYALIVALNQYRLFNSSLTKPVGDAKAFRRWLIDPARGSVPRLNCKSIIQARYNTNAVVSEVKKKFLELCKRSRALYLNDTDAWEKSRIYIYFAGHGIACDSTDSDLLLYDAGVDFWENRLPCTTLLNYLTKNSFAFREVVIFADCCRTFEVGASNSALIFDATGSKALPVSFATGYATGFNDKAFEPTDVGRGFFTQALLEGLNGQAAPANQPINIRNLRNYVEVRVEELSQAATNSMKKQSPMISATQNIFFHNSPALPPAQVAAGQVEITFLSFNGDVRLEGPKGTVPDAQHFSAKIGAKWPLPALERGLYQVIAESGDASLLRDDGKFAVDVAGEPLEVLL